MNVDMFDHYRTIVNNLNREQMAFVWRFASVGHPLVSGHIGEIFAERFFRKLGGFDVTLSKRLGYGYPTQRIG